MADLSITISNEIRVHGQEPTNVWGTITWNQNWGSGNINLPMIVGKVLDGETLTMTEAWSLVTEFNKTISETMTLAGATVDQHVQEPNGYYKVVDGSTNFEDRTFTSYSEFDDPETTYSAAVSPNTTWTEQ